MSRAPRVKILIAGIGSPHGDDRAGWAVIDHLSSRLNSSQPNVTVRRIKVPHELIDHLDGVNELHLVDAARTSPNEEPRLRKFRFQVGSVPEESNFVPATETVAMPIPGALEGDQPPDQGVLPRTRSDSSHHIDLLSVLRLLVQLGRLPEQVHLWAVPASSFGASETISVRCKSFVTECVDDILKDSSRG